MKKLIFIVCVFSVGMQAQIAKLGVKAGINYANQTGSGITVTSENYKAEAITSYHAGLVLELKVLEKFAIQPELLYSTQGATYKNALTEFKNELGYVSIPVLAKIYVSNSFSIELGPQASFLLSNKDNVDFEKPETFEIAAAAGVGIKITDKFFAQARYTAGLTEASKNASIKNSVVQVSLGVLF